MAKTLVEATNPVLFTIVEGKGDGKIYARGEFGRVDVPTANGRIYPESLMQREINRLKEDIDSRSVSVCGCCDHPENGKTSLGDISHVITDLYIKDGIVYGEAEILDKLPKGQMLRGLIESGIKVGVSSRGYGSTAPARGMKGEEVQSDFVLKTYDFVSDPAMKTAIPQIYTEDVDDKTLADLFLERFPEIAQGISAPGNLSEEKAVEGTNIREQIEQELSENFERKLKDTIIALKEDVSAQLREEYGNDPAIGGAKGVLAAIAEMVSAYVQPVSEDAVKDAVKKAELEVSEAVAERDKYAALAKKAAYSLRVEQMISGHAMAGSIRKIIEGKEFDTLSQLEEAVTSIIADFGDVVSKDDAKLIEENATLKGRISLLENKIDELKLKVERSVALGERVEAQRLAENEEAKSKILKLESLLDEETAKVIQIKEDADERVRKAEDKAYKLTKTAPFANNRKLMSVVESINDPQTVDSVVDGLGVRRMGDPMLEDAVRSVRGRSSSKNMVTEDFKPRANEEFDELGNSLDEMARWAGIPE